MSKATNNDVKDMLDIAETRMLSALTSYYNWKWFSQVTNINNNGKETAEKYVAIVNRYRSFLRHSVVISYKSFVIDLAVFFDSKRYADRFSLKELTARLQQIVTDQEFKQLNAKIENIKKSHGITIKFLLDELRNADVIHQEIKPTERKINYEQFEDFFKAIQEILNLISKECDNSLSSWFHIEKEVIYDLEAMFSNLQRGELVRLKEIKEKYKKLKT